eukprot:CAMPEP_0170574636 /NCGR_PEP_ID=MMETSP0224-20130122/3410_1 /TAXON_ID=285029 /ORGANISM="Togula jolla, Strain CCCM 725" /LENGTH=31 /DNA_ID= /DNA_START= /DNA_END= /DNA_ORIENTATION=
MMATMQEKTTRAEGSFLMREAPDVDLASSSI